MKLFSKIGLCVLPLVGMVTVCAPNVDAATQTIYSNSNYSIESRAAKTVVTNKSASYSYAYADLTIHSNSGSGLKQSLHQVYLSQNGSLTLKASALSGASPQTCSFKLIGTVGAGKWTILNSAIKDGSALVGWSGILKYESDTSSTR